MLAFLEQTINLFIELAILAGGGAFFYMVFLAGSTTGDTNEEKHWTWDWGWSWGSDQSDPDRSE